MKASTRISVQNHIESIRQLLDNEMYGPEPVSDEEYPKVREIYNIICEVNDKL